MLKRHFRKATQSLRNALRNQHDRQWHDQIDKQAALVGKSVKGVIILGDISGYTRLVTNVELEHARAIIFQLFDSVYKATRDEFIVNEIEGDAIFAYCVNPPNPAALIAATLEQMKDYGHAFYHARTDFAAAQRADDKACQCNACGNVPDLSLKFIIHYGDFAFNQIGPFVKLIGGDVVLAHRLLKNAVPGKAYVLMTQETMSLIPKALQASFTPLIEKIEHFGDVPVAYRLFDWEVEDQKHH